MCAGETKSKGVLSARKILQIKFRMFSQSFMTLWVLLIMSGISLKAHEVRSERLAGSDSNEESAPKIPEEGMERLLALKILDRNLGTLLSDGLAAQQSKRSPDLPPVKSEDLAAVRSLDEATDWSRRTFAFPFQYPFDSQRRQEMLMSRRNSKGTKFSLSLDVPTSILSILIDLAKAKDMRAKAAANAELMARIGK